MPAGSRDDKHRTVLLATDVGSYSTPVVNLAVEIAASVDSKLQGLFVEDEELLALMQSPLTREISLLGAAAMPTGGERAQRMLRSVSRQFETTLAREAGALKIAWSYQYVRGRMQEVGLKAGLEVGITILSRTGLHRVENARAGGTRRVFMIADASPRQADALAVVLRRFAGAKVEITLVVDEAGGAAALELGQCLATLANRGTLHEVERPRMPELLRQAGSAFDCAILPMRENAGDLALALRTLQCPVILVA